MESMVIGMSETELNAEAPEAVTGGTPMSIPGGKRSGRRNSEKGGGDRELVRRPGKQHSGKPWPEAQARQ